MEYNKKNFERLEKIAKLADKARADQKRDIACFFYKLGEEDAVGTVRVHTRSTVVLGGEAKDCISEMFSLADVVTVRLTKDKSEILYFFGVSDVAPNFTKTDDDSPLTVCKTWEEAIS